MLNKFESVRNLINLAKQKGKLFAWLTGFITLSGVTETVGIGSLYPMIDMVTDESKKIVYLNKVNAFLNISVKEDLFVSLAFLSVALIYSLRGFILIIVVHLQFRLSEMLKVKLQNSIFNNYLEQDYDFFVRHQTGDLIQRQMTHTISAGQAVMHSCQLIKQLFVVIFLFLLMAIISIKAVMIISIAMVIFAFIFIAYSRLKIYISSLENALLQKKIYSLATEVITGIRQVKAFTGEEFFKKQFLLVTKKRAKLEIKISTIAQSPGPTMQTVMLLGTLSILFYAARFTADPKSFLPVFAVMILATYRIATAMAQVYSDLMQLGHYMPSVNIISNLIDLESEENIEGKNVLFKNIQFENVTFKYPQKDFKLDNITINFNKGRFYGIVGPSGSGKSTLVDLLIKFYSPCHGTIKIGNVNLSEIDSKKWRKKIGLVSQDTFIFNGTVEENISFAKELSGLEKDKIIKSAKIADLHDFIEGLPKGYETEVGERGLTLSGGQRQRLAIARAVFTNPDLYIFDEATSALDSYSEKKIQQSIEQLSKSNTVIAIAHRLSTIINADEIIVMNNGVIVEKGKHIDLIQKGDFYSNLYHEQHSK